MSEQATVELPTWARRICCGDHPWYAASPWRLADGSLLATDGKIAVLLAQSDCPGGVPPEGKNPDKLLGTIQRMNLAPARRCTPEALAVWLEGVPVQPEPATCPNCLGRGRVECRDCLGTGEGGECPYCDRPMDCENCDGEGSHSCNCLAAHRDEENIHLGLAAGVLVNRARLLPVVPLMVGPCTVSGGPIPGEGHLCVRWQGEGWTVWLMSVNAEAPASAAALQLEG